MGNEGHLTLTLGPIKFDVVVLLMMLMTISIVFGLVYWASRNLKLKPTGKQNVLEWIIEFVGKVVTDNQSAKEVKTFHLFSFVLFLFMLTANNLGLMTKIGHESSKGVEFNFWKSPTTDPVITLTFALMVVLLANYMGVRRFGFKKYFTNSFLKPVPFIFPMKILEEFTNVLTLGLRLFGNIYAGEVLLGLVAGMVTSRGFNSFIYLPFAIPLEVVWTGFSVFISCIQAFIFVTLCNVYIGHKVLEEH